SRVKPTVTIDVTQREATQLRDTGSLRAKVTITTPTMLTATAWNRRRASSDAALSARRSYRSYEANTTSQRGTVISVVRLKRLIARGWLPRGSIRIAQQMR